MRGRMAKGRIERAHGWHTEDPTHTRPQPPPSDRTAAGQRRGGCGGAVAGLRRGCLAGVVRAGNADVPSSHGRRARVLCWLPQRQGRRARAREGGRAGRGAACHV
eukprot:4132540-Prymnesium_polylepis.2